MKRKPKPLLDILKDIKSRKESYEFTIGTRAQI